MAITITKRPFKLSFSGNPVHYELTSALAATDPDIYFEIRLMFRPVNNGVFTEVHRWPFYPTAGIAEISVHDLLHSKLEWQMPEWSLDEKQPQEARQHTGEFYIEFREITPTNQTPAWDSTESEFICTVMRGGINYFVWRGNNYWVNYHQVKKPFLTWQQNGRKAQPIERMFLGWLCTKDPAAGQLNVEARCKVTYRDGTFSQVVETFHPELNIFYFIPSGFLQWDLGALDPTKDVHYWEITLVDVTDSTNPQQLSEVFKYHMDNRWSLNDITLTYRCSLGGVDTVTVRGVLDQNLDYQFTEQNRTFKADYFDSHVITAQKMITETREQKTWKGDIGHLGREEQDRLRDAQLLRDVYMASRKKWLPVNIVTKNFKLRSTTDMRFTMPIEFTLAYDGAEYYTPESVDLGDGVFTANVCLATIQLDLVSKDYDSVAPDVECTFIGAEFDPQNASNKWRYRLNGGPWVEKFVSDLQQLVIVLPADTGYTMEYQSICTGDIFGKKKTLTFDTNVLIGPPPPDPFPISIAEVSNTGTPGSTRTQVIEYNGVSVNSVLPANIELGVAIYSHDVIVVSDGTQTLNQLLDQLKLAINGTNAADWDSAGSAPPIGTPGFKPVASHSSGSNRLTIVLDYQHQAMAWAHWH